MNTSSSNKLFKASQQVIPGGVNSPVRAFKSVVGDPLFMDKGRGAHIYDVDSNKYIDFCMSWGPLILGHCDKEVLQAIIETAKKGTSFGTPNELKLQ